MKKISFLTGGFFVGALALALSVGEISSAETPNPAPMPTPGTTVTCVAHSGFRRFPGTGPDQTSAMTAAMQLCQQHAKRCRPGRCK